MKGCGNDDEEPSPDDDEDDTGTQKGRKPLPTGSTLGQVATEKSILRLLAIEPRTEQYLLDKLGVKKDKNFIAALVAAAKPHNDAGSVIWHLRSHQWAVFNVWAHSYTTEERQKVIENAKRQYDRMKLSQSHPARDRLLAENERGQGETLSRIQKSSESDAARKSVPERAENLTSRQEVSSAVLRTGSLDASAARHEADEGPVPQEGALRLQKDQEGKDILPEQHDKKSAAAKQQPPGSGAKKRRYACEICYQTYSRRDLLRRHVARHRQELSMETAGPEMQPMAFDAASGPNRRNDFNPPLQDYQIQLLLLETQRNKRTLMARLAEPALSEEARQECNKQLMLIDKQRRDLLKHVGERTTVKDTLKTPEALNMPTNSQKNQGSYSAPDNHDVNPVHQRTGEINQGPGMICKDPECEHSSTRYASEEALKKHISEEHIQPRQDPLKHAQQNLAAALGINPDGTAIQDSTAATTPSKVATLPGQRVAETTAEGHSKTNDTAAAAPPPQISQGASGIRWHKCPHCLAPCSSYEALSRHVSFSHGAAAELHPCTTCSSYFQTQDALKKHTVTHLPLDTHDLEAKGEGHKKGSSPSLASSSMSTTSHQMSHPIIIDLTEEVSDGGSPNSTRSPSHQSTGKRPVLPPLSPSMVRQSFTRPNSPPHPSAIPPPQFGSIQLSAGADGPPNPFARLPLQGLDHVETPPSALSSRRPEDVFLASNRAFFSKSEQPKY